MDVIEHKIGDTIVTVQNWFKSEEECIEYAEQKLIDFIESAKKEGIPLDTISIKFKKEDM